MWVASALVSLVVALAMYQHLFPHFSTTMVGFGNGDPNQAAWFLANTAHAISTFSNPFVSHLVNVPDGANMMANTSTIAVGALFAPVTLAFGPVVALNMVFITGIAATAWSFAFVARKMGLGLLAALLVGVLAGFPPIRMIHGQGQPFLVFAIGTPWLLYSVWKMVEGHSRGLNVALQSSFWVVWSALVSLERLFIISLPIALYIVIRLWHFRSSEALRSRVITILQFVGVTCLALVWPLYEFLYGEQALHGPPHDWLMGFSSHVRDFFAAGPWMLWQGIGASDHSTGFLSGNFIDASYIGIPVFLAFVWGAWRMRHSCAVRCLTAATLVSLVLSCGLRIAWSDSSWSIQGIYALLQHVPGFDSAHPLNFQIVTSIAMAFVIGLAFDDYLASPRMRRVPAVVAVVVLVLSIAPHESFATTPITVKHWLNSDAGRQVIPDGSVVLTYPYPQNIVNLPMLDQAIAGMRYRLIGGQVTVPDSKGHGQSVQPLNPPAMFDLFANAYLGRDLLSLYNVPVGPMPPPGASTTAALRAFVRNNHVDVIVMEFSGAEPFVVAERLNAAFGVGTVIRRDNVIWWDVHHN